MNKVEFVGQVTSDTAYSHIFNDVSYYSFMLTMQYGQNNKVSDTVKIIYDPELPNADKIENGRRLRVKGRLIPTMISDQIRDVAVLIDSIEVVDNSVPYHNAIDIDYQVLTVYDKGTDIRKRRILGLHKSNNQEFSVRSIIIVDSLIGFADKLGELDKVQVYGKLTSRKGNNSNRHEILVKRITKDNGTDK